MRKTVLVSLVLFSATMFGISSMAQRRGRGRGRAAVVAPAAPSEPPMTDHIAEELGTIQWGQNHDAVVDYFRRTVTARYQPQLRNQGQVEQDRLMAQRDAEIETIRRSYINFNGQPAQRRWDTSYIREEYTHSNGESMLLVEDPASGNREFFFFFNDRLWKRYQARTVPRGMTFEVFLSALEGLFGAGMRVTDPSANDRTVAARWQDANTHLRVMDQSTFYNAYALVYEERSTLSRLAELRRNAPAPTKNGAETARDISQPQVGNVANDPNADIIDRITGKIRNVQQGNPAPAGGAGGAGQGGAAGSNRRPDGGAAAPGAGEDDTRMFRGI